MYADFAYYQGTYHGSLVSEADWSAIEREAEGYVNLLTYWRLKWNHTEDIPDEVKLAVCAVADVVLNEHAAAKKAASHEDIKSYSNDGYSETFESMQVVKSQYAVQKEDAVNLYLPLSHPLRYAGVD